MFGLTTDERDLLNRLARKEAGEPPIEVVLDKGLIALQKIANDKKKEVCTKKNVG